ncbi:hypothetical protein DPEC_G00094900 [Dallia pectoralis]|uniref:Uncharacterized protein n=1 Tax=Dallia pectoralis TaxID=75939 RepID=A0ACC2H136_DALPE|nr:hypothetical protein DPEC_G00094900 [Dallia pectoralis]
MRRPPTSDEDTDGEQQSGPFVPELSTSTPPRRDEPLMELTSDEEDQDGEQQPEPLVLPVTKDGRETVQSLLDFAVPKTIKQGEIQGEKPYPHQTLVTKSLETNGTIIPSFTTTTQRHTSK